MEHNPSLNDEDLCINIIKQENYYDILGLHPECKKNEIKKAYKFFALKVHPDKNSSQHARLAFQKLSRAFVCLSSDNLRAIYDQIGSEETSDFSIYEDFDDNLAEKVFSECFQNSRKFGSKPSEPVYKSYLAKCFILQILPIFVILAICIYTTSQSDTKLYSLSISPTYNVRKITNNYNISYYISTDLNRRSNHTIIKAIEDEIESRHIIRLKLLESSEYNNTNQEKYYFEDFNRI